MTKVISFVYGPCKVAFLSRYYIYMQLEKCDLGKLIYKQNKYFSRSSVLT